MASLGRPGKSNHGSGYGAAGARRDAGAHRDLAVAEVVYAERSVRSQARHAARRDDARAAQHVGAPDHGAARPVEGPHFRGGARDEPIAAEIRAAKVDARHDRAPARGVPQAGGGQRRRRGRAGDVEGGRVCAVGLRGRIDLAVGLAGLAEGLARLAQRAPQRGQAQVARLRAVAPQDGAHQGPTERQRAFEEVGDAERGERVHGRASTTREGERRGASSRSAQRERERTVSRDPDADEHTRDFSARDQRQAALPRVERAPRELDEALGHEQRVAFAQVDAAAANLGAQAPAKEQRVQVGVLDGGVGQRARVDLVGGDRALPHGELRAERHRCIPIRLDHDGHRLGHAHVLERARREGATRVA